MDPQPNEHEPAGRTTRRRRPRRWRRALTWAAIIVLGPALLGGIAAVIYVSSVRLPADPIEPQASTLFYRDGRTILARVGTENHSDVPLAKVPPGVRYAVMAAEDRDFYHHSGVSVRGVLRALVANVHGKREGASTITQQYARNAFLTQAVSVDRKTREFALAIKLEQKYSKDQILERYLNTIYYGRGSYGIAAAAHAYFGVTVDRLTAAQGAVLASAIKDPYRYDPANDAKAAQQRWTWVIGAERSAGWLADAPAYPKVLPATVAAAGPNGVVIDRVEQELAANGITPGALHTQGLSVVTTLDAQAQQAALKQVPAHLSGQPKDLRVALVALDPHTGGVLAYYGGKQRGYFDDASAAHPAASTFKPIVLAEALRVGISADSRWNGSSPREFPGRLGVPLKNHNDLQCPDCSLTTSMIESLNTPFYAVTELLGAQRIGALAHQLGISPRYGDQPTLVDGKGDPKPGQTRPDIAIGRYAVTPADLASVYSTFAGQGVQRDRHFLRSVINARGKTVWTAKPKSRTVLDPAVTSDISSVLSAVVGTDDVVPDRPAAGKTGTQQWGNTHDNQDAWMAGYTPDLATSVWIGKADPGPIRDRRGKAIDGDTIPAKLWQDFTRDALRGHPATPFPPPAHLGKAGAFDVAQPSTTDPAKLVRDQPQKPDYLKPTGNTDQRRQEELAKKNGTQAVPTLTKKP